MPHTRKPKSSYQRESFDASLPTITDEMRADLDKGILRNVRILGPKSRNGRLYPRHVVEAAISKYDGVPCNLNHRASIQSDVSVGDRFGRFRSPRMDVDGGVRADLHFNPKHLYAESFRWWVENDPSGVGFSQFGNWESQAKYIDNQWIEQVECINAIASVDLVADPATTSGLFESENPGANVDPKPEEIAKSLTTVDALKAFIASLLSASTLSAEDKLAVVEGALSSLDSAPVDVATPAAESVTLARLAKRGQVGAWASAQIMSARVAAQQNERFAKAKQLIADAKLPEAMAGESLVNVLVGVSHEQAVTIVNGLKESLLKLPTPAAPNPTKTNGTPTAMSVDEMLASVWGK